MAIFALLITSLTASAATIGASTPAQPLTAERIAKLPPAQQPAWKAYLDRSERQMKADRAALNAELQGRLAIRQLRRLPGWFREQAVDLSYDRLH